MSRKIYFFILLIAGFALSGCWLPPFDENATLAALSEKNLTSQFYISGVTIPSGYSVKFCPVLASKKGGYLLLESASLLKVRYRTASTTYAPATNYEITLSSPIPGWKDTAMGVFFGSSSAGGNPSAFVLLPDAVAAAADTDHYYFSYSSGTMAEVTETASTKIIDNIATSLSLTASELTLIGFGSLPSDTATAGRTLALVYRESTNVFYEAEFVYNSTFILTSFKNINTDYRTPSTPTFAVPASLTPPTFGRYFYCELSKRSYLNYVENGVYKTLYWDSSTAVASFPVQERIECVLTTGELLTKVDGLGKVYDKDGTLKYKIPLGTLEPAYETYIDNVATLLFVKPLAMDSNGTEYKYFVYSLPTDELSLLKQ